MQTLRPAPTPQSSVKTSNRGADNAKAPWSNANANNTTSAEQQVPNSKCDALGAEAPQAQASAASTSSTVRAER